jgi:hypothetical protein
LIQFVASFQKWNRKGVFPMIVPFIDSVTGTSVYINPAFVLSVRPDPADLDHVSLIKLQDGEIIRVRGEHSDVAEKLARSR